MTGWGRNLFEVGCYYRRLFPGLAPVRPPANPGLEVATSLRLLGNADGTTLLEVIPVTGRTNQIRIHLWELGFPILRRPRVSAQQRAWHNTNSPRHRLAAVPNTHGSWNSRTALPLPGGYSRQAVRDVDGQSVGM